MGIKYLTEEVYVNRVVFLKLWFYKLSLYNLFHILETSGVLFDSFIARRTRPFSDQTLRSSLINTN